MSGYGYPGGGGGGGGGGYPGQQPYYPPSGPPEEYYPQHAHQPPPPPRAGQDDYFAQLQQQQHAPPPPPYYAQQQPPPPPGGGYYMAAPPPAPYYADPHRGGGGGAPAPYYAPPGGAYPPYAPYAAAAAPPYAAAPPSSMLPPLPMHGGGGGRRGGGRSRSPGRQAARPGPPPPPLQMKPGEIAFSILIPVIHPNHRSGSLAEEVHHQGQMMQHEFAVEDTRIVLTAPDGLEANGVPKRVVKFVGRWPGCFQAQRRVLEWCLRPGGAPPVRAVVAAVPAAGAGAAVVVLDCEQLVLLPASLLPQLEHARPQIEQQTQTQIRAFTSSGAPPATAASAGAPSHLPPGVDVARLCLVSVSIPPLADTEAADIVSKSNRISNALRLVKEALTLDCFQSDEPPTTSTAEDSPATTVLPIPARFAGSVIGKNAQIVRDMEHATGARILMSKEGQRIVNQASGEVYRFVTLEGASSSQVQHAARLVRHHLQEAKDRDHAVPSGTLVTGPPPPSRGGGGGPFRVPLSVPDHLIGVIIGKGGKALKQLQEEFHVKVVIEHNEDASVQQKQNKMHRMVEIIGDVARVEDCERYVVEKLIEAASCDALVPMPSSMAPPLSQVRRGGRSRDRGGGRQRGPSPPASSSYVKPVGEPFAGEGQERMLLTVPISQVGAVIGNRGGTVRQICEESGGRVHIEGKEELAPDATARRVTITGHPHQVIKAYELVQRALYESNEARKHSGAASSIPFSQHARGADLITVLSSTIPVPGGAPQQPAHAPPPQPQQHHLPQLPPQQHFYPAMPPAYLPAGPPPAPAPHPAPEQRLFDPDKLSILASQLTKNFPPVGSGNITQITGSPNPQQQQQQPQHQRRY